MKSVISLSSVMLLPVALILSLSCCRKNAPQNSKDPVKQDQQATTRLVSPKPNAILTCGDSVSIEISLQDKNLRIDSLSIAEGKKVVITHHDNFDRVYWSSEYSRVGQTTLRISAYLSDNSHESHNVNLVILSDIKPIKYTYRVIKKFPHDDEAYTQGLFYDNGLLYESTGLEGKSSVRIVNISTGKPDKLIALAPKYFGEGIALYKDQIYQVTYKSQVGFVYDKKTLDLIRSFDYQIREGWGLTTDGENLIMSDGSAQLFFIEPEFFTQVDRIEVFDNKGMIDSLNEIEFIKGKVLANVYGQSYIVMVDPLTGKVVGKLEMHGLIPDGFEGDYGKVLNGIAYNPLTGHLYITGKNWPVLYEIALDPSL